MEGLIEIEILQAVRFYILWSYYYYISIIKPFFG